MPLRFMNRSILDISGDVIVNPSDGVSFCDNNISKAIAAKGGAAYTEAIGKLSPLKMGTAFYTQAGDLQFKFVAHVALPDWYGGKKNEREFLDSCYNEVMYMADERKCKTIVFPLLGVGLYGTPYEEAVNIAVRAIESYLSIKDNLTVTIATTSEETYEYIRENFRQYCTDASIEDTDSLEHKLSHLDYQFIDSLSYYMKQRNYTPVQCYTAAGIDKKLYSKIKNNPGYLPSKDTIIRFAFALQLSVSATQQLLGTCGYVLSDSLAKDVLTKHYISEEKYEYDKLREEILKRSL